MSTDGLYLQTHCLTFSLSLPLSLSLSLPPSLPPSLFPSIFHIPYCISSLCYSPSFPSSLTLSHSPSAFFYLLEPSFSINSPVTDKPSPRLLRIRRNRADIVNVNAVSGVLRGGNTISDTVRSLREPNAHHTTRTGKGTTRSRSSYVAVSDISYGVEFGWTIRK